MAWSNCKYKDGIPAELSDRFGEHSHMIKMLENVTGHEFSYNVLVSSTT